jgi:hypothetical protein
MTGKNTAIDKDGNIIRKGVMVRCDGDTWVVGYCSRSLIRLDRKTKTSSQSMLVGRNRFLLIGVIGFQISQVINQ